MMVLWDAGVNTGRLTPSEFVKVTSANCAQIFNIYPRKGVIAVGADADIVLWDAHASKTLSSKTQFSKGDFNVFEGRTVKGIPTYTISNGKLVYKLGQLMAQTGAGNYVKRPPFSAMFGALNKMRESGKQA